MGIWSVLVDRHHFLQRRLRRKLLEFFTWAGPGLVLLVECLPNMDEALSSIPSTTENLGVVLHPCNLSTWEGNAGNSEFSSPPLCYLMSSRLFWITYLKGRRVLYLLLHLGLIGPQSNMWDRAQAGTRVIFLNLEFLCKERSG